MVFQTEAESKGRIVHCSVSRIESKLNNGNFTSTEVFISSRIREKVRAVLDLVLVVNYELFFLMC